MRKIYLLTLLCSLLGVISMAQVTVTGSTGANGSYTSLTKAGGAFAALNAAGSQTGNTITISLAPAIINEDGTNQLNGGGWTSLKIITISGGALSGTVNGPLITLNGTSAVTIDGVSNNLTINNFSLGALASTIRFINDASNNIITGTNIVGSSTGLGTIYFSSGITTGNDNNIISNCNIYAPVAGAESINNIYSFGTSPAVDNSGNTITGCAILNFFNPTLASAGININSNNSSWTITNNVLWQSTTKIYTAGNTHSAIFISSGSGYTITGNLIGKPTPASTSTTNMIGLSSGFLGGSFPSAFTSGGTANATRFVGINCGFTAGAAVSSIQDNTISNIDLYTSSGATTTFGTLCGIAVTSGNANIGTVTGNTIGSSSSGSLYVASTSGGGVISGIYCTTTNTINIQNNLIGGIDASGTTATTGQGFKGIDVAGSGTYTISNNSVGNSSANNIRTGYLLTGANLSNAATTPTSASGGAAVRGILCSSTGATASITNNTLRGIQMSNSNSAFTGISITGAITTTLDVTGNNLGSGGIGLVTFSVTNSGTLTGISNTGTAATATLNLNNNTIDGMTVGSSGLITGISNIGGTTGTIVNMNGNSILNTVINGAGVSTSLFGITNSAAVSTLSMISNIIRSNTSSATTGAFTGIQNTGPVVTTVNITDNQIGNASGNAVIFTATTSNFLTAINNTGVSTTTINLNNNLIYGITCPNSGFVTGISSTGGSVTSTVNINNNSFTNNVINGAGAPTSMTVFSNGANASTLSMSGNIIRNNSSTATTGSFTGIVNSAAVVNSIDIINNQVGNASGGPITFSAVTSGIVNCIYNSVAAATCTINLNNNSIDGISVVSCAQVTGISNAGNTATTINFNNNQLGSVTGTLISYSGAMAGTLMGIYNNGGTSAATLSIQGNDITGISQPVAGSGQYQLIRSGVAVLSQTVSSNTFTNLTLNTTNVVQLILRQGAMASGASWTCNSNSIVTQLSKTGSGNSLAFMSSAGASVTGSTMTETGNNFSNVTVTGNTTMQGWYNLEGASNVSGPTKICTGNTFNNIAGGSALVTVMYIDRSASTTCSLNTISNISGTAVIDGIFFSTSNGAGPHTLANNTITGISAGANVYCIYGPTDPSVSNGWNISNNQISGVSSIGPSADVYGIYVGAFPLATVNDNTIQNISNTGTGNGTVTGISTNSANAINVYNNKISNLLLSGAITSGNGVTGMFVFNPTTANVNNNFISDLRAPAANFVFAICGMFLPSAITNSTYNIYYNSIYINASSSGTDFGSHGIMHGGDATATTGTLNMIDNIIVNTSVANGTGKTVAFRRTNDFMNNYAATCDYNLFYVGTPGPKNLIFSEFSNSDQTLAAFQTRVNPREVNSITVMPNFTSSTDLHLTTNNCWIDGKGTPVAVTTDIDGATRDLATPDMGADEFSSSLNTTLVSSSVCENKTVSVIGTNYNSNGCDLIARVLPSGGAAVSGKINVCATLDATQQYFNAEPYVKRHFDIEPTTSNTTTTSATITLYFTDAEFVNFNTLNPGWPKLPTVAGGGNADANRSNLRITQYHGQANASPSTPNNYPSATTGILINPLDANIVWNGSYWAVTFDITGFSGFYVHTNLFDPLAVSVNYFRGTRQGSSHLLDWKVSCNSTPSVTMTLERSASSAGGFTGINTISATAARCNQPFSYTDAQPLSGMNYYRLKMVDADGKISYSTTIALLNATKGFDIMNIAPNPVTGGNFKLNVASAQPTKLDVVITDMMGRVVNRQTISLISGYNSIDMNVSGLAKGTYNIFGTVTDDRSRVLRFVKQ